MHKDLSAAQVALRAFAITMAGVLLYAAAVFVFIL
jgi:hypothetical protein